MAKRKISNLLALAVLSLLHEKPMHPYEIGTTMRQRRMSDTIKLNTGSLYAVVDSLLRSGLIEPIETQKEGKHPERTIYGPTEEGKKEFFEWLRSIIRTPQKEYYQFAAGLSFLGHFSPQETIGLLEERVASLDSQLKEMRLSIEESLAAGLDRVFQIESEYSLALLEAEYRWLQQLIGEIQAGPLTVTKDGHLVWNIKPFDGVPYG